MNRTLYWRQDLVDKAHVLQIGVITYILKMTPTMRVWIKQNPPTEADHDQPTTSRGICVPQDPYAASNAILRLTKTVPKALTIKKGKGKHSNTETMPIVVYDDATQLLEQMPSPPKARPPYATWALIKPQRQIQDDMEHNLGHGNWTQNKYFLNK